MGTVVISRVISRVAVLITHIRGLIAPLITTPEPPSSLIVKAPMVGLWGRVLKPSPRRF